MDAKRNCQSMWVGRGCHIPQTRLVSAESADAYLLVLQCIGENRESFRRGKKHRDVIQIAFLP